MIEKRYSFNRCLNLTDDEVENELNKGWILVNICVIPYTNANYPGLIDGSSIIREFYFIKPYYAEENSLISLSSITTEL